MYRKIVLVVIAVLVAGGIALAADKSDNGAKSDNKTRLSLSKMTCEDFVMLDETIRPKVVYYSVAYARGGKPEDAVIDIDGTEKITPIIFDECQKEPKASYWQRLEANVKKFF